MPNILKNFMAPRAGTYAFPDACDLTQPDVMPEIEEPELPEPEELEEELLPDLPTPKTPVDFAKLEADAILQRAQEQADELLQRVREQAAKDVEEQYAAAHQEGYDAGYAEGLAKALTEAKAQREAQALDQAKKIQQFLDAAAKEQDALIDKNVDELRDLAIAIAEKVVRVSLKSSSDIIGRMILAATEKRKRREWVHIYIAGCDAKGVAETPPALSAALSSLSDHVRIVPMADEESGTCLIETQSSMPAYQLSFPILSACFLIPHAPRPKRKTYFMDYFNLPKGAPRCFES